jgi:hypothetical protein
MIELLDLRQTLDAFAACNDDDDVWQRYGWVYATDADVLDAQFWLAPRDEDGDADALQTAARALGLSTFLEAATFADVLDVQKRQRPLSALDDYAHALAHYLEDDAFAQVEGIDEALGTAPAEEQDIALASGVGAGIFASFDLVLAACPPAQLKDVARRVAEHLQIPLGQALPRCRALPLLLGESLDRNHASALAADFSAVGAPLQVRGYRAFPWMAAPTLA